MELKINIPSEEITLIEKTDPPNRHLSRLLHVLKNYDKIEWSTEKRVYDWGCEGYSERDENHRRVRKVSFFIKEY